eukprot:COSAG01_NODE_11008_length_2028_cov_2.390358_1_plen_45_part_10
MGITIGAPCTQCLRHGDRRVAGWLAGWLAGSGAEGLAPSRLTTTH